MNPTRIVQEFIKFSSEYLDIITHKTAELFSAACEISGVISEVSSEKRNKSGHKSKNCKINAASKNRLYKFFS